MIHRAPEIVGFAVDSDENLVEIPPPRRIEPLVNATSSDLSCEQRTEPVPPVANGFMADINTSLKQEIFTWRKESGKRMYIMTARRMTSGDVLKYLKGFVMSESYETPI